MNAICLKQREIKIPIIWATVFVTRTLFFLMLMHMCEVASMIIMKHFQISLISKYLHFCWVLNSSNTMKIIFICNCNFMMTHFWEIIMKKGVLLNKRFLMINVCWYILKEISFNHGITFHFSPYQCTAMDFNVPELDKVLPWYWSFHCKLVDL